MAKTALIVKPGVNAATVARELDRDPALRDYLASLRSYTTLTREEEQRLGRQARSADASAAKLAKETLVQHNLRLVVTIAKRFVGQGLPMLDLIQEGTIGLIEAVERYDPRPNVRFCSYAGWWIHQAMHRALVNIGSMIRLPSYLNELRVKVQRFTQRFEAEHGRAPSEAELRLATGATASALHDAQGGPATHVSLDATLTSTAGEDDTLILAETLADTSEPDLDTQITERETTAALYATLRATLTPEELLVLAYRYGLGGLGRTAAGEANDGSDAPLLKQRSGALSYLQSESVEQKAFSQPSGITSKTPQSGSKLSTGGLMQYEAIALRMTTTADRVRRLETSAMKKLRSAFGVEEMTRLAELLVA